MHTMSVTSGTISKNFCNYEIMAGSGYVYRIVLIDCFSCENIMIASPQDTLDGIVPTPGLLGSFIGRECLRTLAGTSRRVKLVNE